MLFTMDSEFSTITLSQATKEYRESRELLVKIQSETKEAFNQITDILKSTTAELLECVNIDDLTSVVKNLGVIEERKPVNNLLETSENHKNAVYDKQIEFKRLEMGNPAIAVIGQVKAGKSTFVNALLKKNVVCSAYETCTGRITRLTYSQINFVEVIDANGNVLKKINLRKSIIPKRYLKLKDKDRDNPIETGKQIRAGIKSDFLANGLDIIDSPGLSENDTLTNLSKDMVKNILPLMIYVIDGRTSVKQTDISDLLELKSSVPNLQIIYFITKLDTDDDPETSPKDVIDLAKEKLALAFKKLQYNHFIPNTYKHWSECPYFHGSSLYCLMDYHNGKVTLETIFHQNQFQKFQSALGYYLWLNFKNKIYEACNTIINFQMDVLTKIISRAKSLVSFSEENLNQIWKIRNIEEELFLKIKSVITNSKADLIDRLLNRLKTESDAIVNPIGEIKYPSSISLPDSGMIIDRKVIEQCQLFILYNICHGLEHVVKQFVEDELFAKYQTEIEAQISARMKREIGIQSAIIVGKNPYSIILKRILTESYKFNFVNVSTKTDCSSDILKLIHIILNDIKRFLWKMWRFEIIKGCADVKNPNWKIHQAKKCLKKCDHNLLAEEVCKSLLEDFENKHKVFLLALECEEKSLQKEIMISEAIRIEITNKTSSFTDLLMQSLDVKGRYMLHNAIQKEIIGQGSQGTVYRCTWNGHDIAKKTSRVSINQLKGIADEVYYSYLFEHPRLLPLIAVSIRDTNSSEDKEISLYIPLMKTDVLNYLQNNKTTFKDRMRIGQQAAEALQYLHKQQIMHRDLKLANILLDGENNVFLADYGLCKATVLSTHTLVGTPIHMAPEIIKNTNYNSKVDIYSFGVLLWYLAEGNGNHPRCATVETGIFQVLWAAAANDTRPERLDNMSDEFWDFMCLCWHKDPLVRPDINCIIEKMQVIIENCSRNSD